MPKSSGGGGSGGRSGRGGSSGNMNPIERQKRIATLQKAVFDGEYRLKSKRNSIGERMSSKQLSAVEKEVSRNKKELKNLT